MIRRIAVTLVSLACLAAVLQSGCRSGTTGGAGGKKVIRVDGSDTMLNLAQAWAEDYSKLHPDVTVMVSGGGSGVGIAALIDGVADMANASRKMTEDEISLAKDKSGAAPQEFIVGLDALAVYVHKQNPIQSISISELAEIYGDQGKIEKWAQLGVKNAGCKSDEITVVSRQNSSGTYHYFREAVLGRQRDYRLGVISQSGSKDVVALIAQTPCAIGYSGMGYVTDEVKWLAVSAEKGEAGVEPSVETAQDSSYPIARPLQIYTSGEPEPHVKDYIDWILSPQGQQIVMELGYVPINDPNAADQESSSGPESSEDTAEPAADGGTGTSADQEPQATEQE